MTQPAAPEQNVGIFSLDLTDFEAYGLSCAYRRKLGILAERHDPNVEVYDPILAGLGFKAFRANIPTASPSTAYWQMAQAVEGLKTDLIEKPTSEPIPGLTGLERTDCLDLETYHAIEDLVPKLLRLSIEADLQIPPTAA